MTNNRSCTDKTTANRKHLRRWYDDMWGKLNFDLIPEMVDGKYLRHDLTGTDNLLSGEEYQQMNVAGGLSKRSVSSFSYFLVAEENYVAALGLLTFTEGQQWDWVQLFRLNNSLLAETWLPGMGGNEQGAFPTPRTAWTENTVPAQPSGSMTDRKLLVQRWYECLANGEDVKSYLADNVRCHDILDSDIVLSRNDMQKRYRELMNNEQATDLRLFMIEEGDFVVATGHWKLGTDKRSWDWIQAFEFRGDKIYRTWITSIGGTDASIVHTSKSSWSKAVMPEESIQTIKA